MLRAYKSIDYISDRVYHRVYDTLISKKDADYIIIFVEFNFYFGVV